MLQPTIYPHGEILQGDRIEIACFVETIFKHATTGFISFRAFRHAGENPEFGRRLELGDDGKQHWVWPAVPIKDHERVIDMAMQMADRCAKQTEPGVVFCPPVCTLTIPWSAKTHDIAEGVALSLECDGPDDKHPTERPPNEAQSILKTILGAPTVGLISGSVWTDPQTGDVQDKWHMHYRLRAPTRTPEEHQKLRDARNLAARIVGSDRSASSLVHPLRWPGSWNCKNQARMAQIIELNDDVEIDLDDTLALLRAVAEEMGLNVRVRDELPPREPRQVDDEDNIEEKSLAAIAMIPNDLSRDDWINIGIELKDGTNGSSAGYNAWHSFSSSWPSYKRTDSDKAWDSFRSGPRTYRSLFKRADDIDPSWRKPFQRGNNFYDDQYRDYLETMQKEQNAEPRYENGRDDNPDAFETETDANISERESTAGDSNTSELEADRESKPSEEWPEPMDIFGALTHEPYITPYMLPTTVSDFAYEQSDLLGTDVGAMAIAALVVCSTMISDNIVIQPKRFDTTYTERALLWLILVGAVSSRKTPMLRKVIGAIKKLEERYRIEDKQAMQTYKRQREVWEIKCKAWERASANGDDQAGQWPPQEPERPRMRRMVTNDYTVESLAPILCDNPRGILIELDEIMQLFGGFDAYKSGGVHKDRPAILQGWNGGSRAVDRVRTTDDPILVPNWSFGVIGGIQTAKLDQIGLKLMDDGLFQRFLTVPVEPGVKEADRLPNAEIIYTYNQLLESLVEFDPKQSYLVHLSDGAHTIREEFEELIRALGAIPGLSEAFHGHVDKMNGIFARLLLTMHVIECHPFYHEQKLATVSTETAQRTFDLLVRFLIPHAVRMYERLCEKTNQTGDDTRWLAGHILAKKLALITPRICHDVNRDFKRDKDRAVKAIGVLVTAGWVNDSGEVNPQIHQMFADRADRERKTRADKQNSIKKARSTIKRRYDKQ